MPRSPVAYLLAILIISCGTSLWSSDAPERLTTARQVRSLSEAEAKAGLPVHLRGVYMGPADPDGIAFILQDQTEGIYAQAPADLLEGLRQGELLEVVGVTDPGGYAPYVVVDELKRLGPGPVPAPVRVSLPELYLGQMDAQWVEVEGIVRSIQPIEPTDAAPLPPGTRFRPRDTRPAQANEPMYKLKLAADNSFVMVELAGPINPDDYVDAEIRLRAICFNLHNRNRQFVKPFLQVPEGVEPVILVPPPGDTFEQEPLPISTILQFGTDQGNHGHRVHLRGTVVHHQPGSYLWLRDGEHCLRVETTQEGRLQPGDQVDVVGFPQPGEYSPILRDAEYRKTGTSPAPQPQPIENVSQALQHDGNLVELRGHLAEVRRFPDSIELTLDWEGVPIRAILESTAGAAYPGTWQPGSLVHVLGICQVEANDPGPLGGLWIPRRFSLLLRSTDDLAILQAPPWWTAERIIWLLASFLLIALAAITLVMWVSRIRLKEQMQRRAMAEAEFSAILRERNRLAREIHDTLSQSLGAISVHLELARTHANEMSQEMRRNLAVAHKMTRDALAEARQSIWNMRSQVLEDCDLSEALARILNQLTDESSVQASVKVHGQKRRLSPLVENNLLRIGQEAINNANKHANATSITVTLTFEQRLIHLAIEDDGVGFSGDEPNPDGRRSFGLIGIRERAQLLDGKVDVVSVPGKGTRVVVTVAD